MNDLNLSRSAISVCVAAILLAGCDGPAQSLSRPAQDLSYSGRLVDRVALPGYAPQHDVSFDKSTEQLNSSYVYVGCYSVGDNVTCDYSTTGSAAGVYNGTFTATGDYGSDDYGRGHGWFFDESFKIMSSSVQIKGHISASGGHSVPKLYKYKSTLRYGSQNIHRAGRAKIEALQQNDFSEVLRQL
jgi:hypothetical protein